MSAVVGVLEALVFGDSDGSYSVVFDRGALVNASNAADRHRMFGLKVINQLAYLMTPELERERLQLVSAQFAECVRGAPPRGFPAFPRETALWSSKRRR